MKFYTSIGPNPRIVKMFMAEKGIDIPHVQLDLIAGENRLSAHVARNPTGQMPTLELDDGSFLAEVTVICEYLEERYPTPPLVGATAEQRAMTRMWTRRVDLYIAEPMLTGFRAAEGHGLFKDRMRLLPQAADDLKLIAREKLAWLDPLIAGRDFIAGPNFSLADIFLYCMLDFGRTVGQPLDPANANLVAWFDRVNARPSAETSRK